VQVCLNSFISKLLCFDFSRYKYDCGAGFNNSNSPKPPGTDSSHEIGGSELIYHNELQTVQTGPQTDNHRAASAWLQLADVVDRLFFILYVIVVVALCLGFLGYL
jgi:hypothetical protein